MPVKNQLAIDIWVYFQTPSSGPLIYISIIMPVPLCFSSFIFMVSFKIKKSMSSKFVLFQDYLAWWGTLTILYENEGCLFYFWEKNGHWNSDRIYTESVNVRIILCHPIQEHRMSVNLFGQSFISFRNILHASVYKYFTSLVKIIATYSILLHAAVNGIIFLISFWIYMSILICCRQKTS